MKCSFGCDREAIFIFKNGKGGCCSKSINSCPSKKKGRTQKGTKRPIPEKIETDELCSFGCGNKANYKFINGNLCCESYWYYCPVKKSERKEYNSSVDRKST